MLQFLCVFGTRPEAVEMAPIVTALRPHPNQIKGNVCVTAQHREMLDQALSFFHIHPDYDVDVMRSNQTMVSAAANIMLGLDKAPEAEQPDWVLVQGDTTTVMAGAVAFFCNRVKIGHVEARLRSVDKWQPYPEEMDLKTVASTADAHVAPTTVSGKYPLREGIADSDVVATSNKGTAALKWAIEQPLDTENGPLAASRSVLVITDSDAIPEEAPGPGTPNLVLRATTQLPEPIDASTMVLEGADAERIFATASMLLDDPAAYAGMAKAVNLFGDGQAAGRVTSCLLER